MNILEEKANEVAAEMAKQEDIKVYALDPFTILTIISIIISLVKIYMECSKTPEQALDGMKKLNLIERWRLKRVIRQHLDDDDVHTVLGKHVFNNLVAQAEKLKLEELKKIYTEVKLHS